MAQSTFSGEQLDKMKADAIRRARQMHSRAAFTPPQFSNQAKKESTKSKNNTPIKKKEENNFLDFQGIFKLAQIMGLSKDQLILFALILLISKEGENLPLTLALLYIAL